MGKFKDWTDEQENPHDLEVDEDGNLILVRVE
jgi:hypothetical protein